MPQRYALNEKQARWVSSKSRSGKSSQPAVRNESPRQPPLSQAAIALTGGSAIAARSGTTPGSATVTLYYISSGALTAYTNINGDPITVTAYNLATSTVAANTYIQVKREFLSGTWLIDFEDCG